MADAQITIVDGDQTQIVLAPGENPSVVTSIPGPQGPAGAGVPLGGTTNQVLFKQSGTNYDTAWGAITSAMIGDLEIVNADVSASAAIAGTKISPNFGSQNVITTGTSTAASFIPSSSTVPTNGVYLPAANSVAISTNGTGTLYIDASGRIGNGVSSAASLSTVYRSTINGDGSTIVGGLSLRNSGTEILTIGSITAANNTDIEIWNPRNGYLRFATNNTERLRITSTGQLSHIGAGTSGSPAVSFSGSAASNSLVIDSNSRVGVGTSSPLAELHINDPTGVSRVRLTGGAVGADNFEIGQSIPGVSNSGFSIYDVDAAASRLVIDSSGRLGIGTQSPASELHVANAAGNAEIRIGNSQTFDHSRIFTTTDDLTISNQRTANLILRTAATERARIDSSGRLLVGTTSARSNLGGGSQSARLQVEGNSGDTTRVAQIQNGNNSNGIQYIFAKSRGTAVGSNTIVQSGDSIGIFSFEGSDGTNFVPAAQIVGAVDGTPGANNMPGRLVFSTTADGAASPTERMRIDNQGRLRVGTDTGRAVEPFGNTTFGVFPHIFEGNGSVDTASILICNNSSTTAGYGSGLALARSRGSTNNSNTIVQSGDNLGTISFSGADGTDIRTKAATISAEVDGTPGANDMPGRLVFSTTADGAASPTERMRITSAGVLQIADAGNIAVGTTTGTKIGTATTQKLGFYNATPVVQPAAVADATDAATVITQLNDLLAKLRTLGIIAT